MRVQSISTQTAPRFSGVYRQKPDQIHYLPSNIEFDDFHYDGETYYVTEQDAALLKQAHRAELVRFFRDDYSGESPLGRVKTHLSNKEANNQFLKALSDRDAKRAYELLQDPEVRLSDEDTPAQLLADRLLTNRKNFKFLARQLNGAEQAKTFIYKILVEEVRPDIAAGINSGDWLEGPDRDFQAMAETLVNESVKRYLKHIQATAHQDSMPAKALQKLAFWKKRTD